MTLLTSPTVRHPDTSSRRVMTVRAWWLVGVNVLIPGSAQVLAGGRRLGRFGLSATLLLWALGIVALVLALFNRAALLAAVANPIALTVLQVLLAGYAVLWTVLTLDTLRLAHLVRAEPGSRPLIALVLVFMLLLTAGGAAYASYLAGVARGTIVSVFGGGDVEPPADGRYNILLLGADAGEDRMGLRPDSISVVSVDAESGATTIVGLPRNFEQATFSEGSPMFGPYPNGYDCGHECLLGYLYTVGEEHSDLYPGAELRGSTAGIEAMRDAAEGITGLTIQYYVLIDMGGFEQLVNALGGVEVTVPERLAYGSITSPAPIGFFEAGAQRLSGEEALWYARSRFDGNDFERMERQRQIQEAVITQLEPANVVTNFQSIADAGSQVVSTDVPNRMVGYFIDLAAKSRELPVGSLEVAPDSGFDHENPDYGMIHARVQEALAPPVAE